MVVDRIGNGLPRSIGHTPVEILNTSVKAADDALQFGEFFHQLRGEISL